MSYLVFARKYRPQTFDEVVRQEHVTRTLANAIEAGRVAHALLFTGPRGTGKTTVARILAKAMNCQQGPTPRPCNTCRSCEEIIGGHAADVFEIDGASNNSVDQVRELRENLKYMPAHSRFKIYIIDEVHMLSLAAFNALLKTLEEPPAHVLFMFATTEPHKIPVTILSRCQRHDLRRIDAVAIIEHMRKICDREGVVIDEESMTLIAQEAGGSMRDALSLLDHVLTCAEGNVSAQLVADLLGAVESRHLFALSAAVFARDIQGVLDQIDTVWRLGMEMKRFYADLVAHFHKLMRLALGDRGPRQVDLPGHAVERMRDQVAQVPASYLLQILDQLFQAEPSIKLSSQPRLAMEMVFLKLLQTPPALSIETLIERLDQLRENGFAGRGGQGGDDSVTDGSHREAIRERAKPAPEAAPEAPLEAPLEAAPETAALSDDTPEVAGDSQPPGADRQPLPDKQVWEMAMRRVEKEKPSLGALIKRCAPHGISQGRMTLKVSENAFAVNTLQKHIGYLENVFRTIAGRALQLEVAADLENAAAKQHEKQQADRLKQEALGHPMVMAAIELFDGKVVDVKVT